MKKIVYVICLILIFTPIQQTSSFSNQVIERGAFGDDVIELQARLQYIGLYKGKIDGIFGYETYWALRNFQKDYGMKVDGIAGNDTKKLLANYSDYNEEFVRKNIEAGNRFTHYGGVPLEQQVQKGTKNSEYQLPAGYTEQDLQILANAVYGESRGEPYEGQVAVAAVILNRIESESFPNTVSEVIFQPGAFTAVADGQIWLEPNEQAKRAVIDAINGWDPSDNALYYFNPDTATSSWIWSRPQIKQIGDHIFCM